MPWYGWLFVAYSVVASFFCIASVVWSIEDAGMRGKSGLLVGLLVLLT